MKRTKNGKMTLFSQDKRKHCRRFYRLIFGSHPLCESSLYNLILCRMRAFYIAQITQSFQTMWMERYACKIICIDFVQSRLGRA